MASNSWRDGAAAFARNRAAMVGLAVLAVFALMALFAPLIQHHDPTEPHLRPPSHANEAPSRSFWLGTDKFGRDEYSRLVHGARISLTVGVVSQLIGVTLGLAVGLTAGLGGRRIDTLTMRLTDISYAFPDLLLLILLVSIRGPSIWMITVAIGLVSWTTIARLVRGQVLSLREEPFVMAARAVGANDAQIAWRHLLPNIAGPVIVAATFGIPQAMFAEAALSFIGLGVPIPTPTWGNLVVESKGALYTAPWLAVASCSAISLTMMSFMIVGDGLRDVLDPRTARRRRSVPDNLATTQRELPALPKAA